MNAEQAAPNLEWRTPPPIIFYHDYHNAVVYGDFMDVGASLDRVFEPTADYYDERAVAYQTVSIPFEIMPVGDLEAIKASPITRPTTNVGPTNAPLPPAAVLSHDLQVIDLCTPNTEWGGGYGTNRQGTYLMIGAQMKTEPLELPRYSYAAIDSNQLYQQAVDNIQSLYADETP